MPKFPSITLVVMGLPRNPRKIAFSGQVWLNIFLFGVILLFMTIWALAIAGSSNPGSQGISLPEAFLFVIFRMLAFAFFFAPVFLAAGMMWIGYWAFFKKKPKISPSETQTP